MARLIVMNRWLTSQKSTQSKVNPNTKVFHALIFVCSINFKIDRAAVPLSDCTRNNANQSKLVGARIKLLCAVSNVDSQKGNVQIAHV